MTVAAPAAQTKRRWQKKPTPASMAIFDEGWAKLLKQIADKEADKRACQDLRAEAYVQIAMGQEPAVSLEELDAREAKIQRDLEPLYGTRAQEGEIRQRVVTQAAAARFEQIIGERRSIERDVRDKLSEMRAQAKGLLDLESELRDLTEKDAELQNEQIGCNDRGVLNRHVEGSLRGIGGGNAVPLMNQIEQDLISIAHRAGS